MHVTKDNFCMISPQKHRHAITIGIILNICIGMVCRNRYYFLFKKSGFIQRKGINTYPFIDFDHAYDDCNSFRNFVS